MSRKISKQRIAAFHNQSGRCYYCDSPIWEDNPKEFAKKHHISNKQAARFKCTAEHLLARCDGGKDLQANIVAACTFCNKTRHQKKNPRCPQEHKAHILKRLKQGKWHPRNIGNSIS